MHLLLQLQPRRTKALPWADCYYHSIIGCRASQTDHLQLHRLTVKTWISKRNEIGRHFDCDDRLAVPFPLSTILGTFRIASPTLASFLFSFLFTV
jgi:hypothetical protein